MDVKDVFRRLASNQFIHDFSYNDTRFPFQTVFYHTPYSYRCCPCAFIHEYVEYISEDGSLDEEQYDQIERSIITGRCPHVADVPSKCVRETKVNAIHVAIASNNIEAASKYYLDYGYVPTKIFKLTPFRLALVRGNSEIIDIAQTALLNSPNFTVRNLVHAKKMMFAYSLNDKGTLNIEFIPTSVYCMRYRKKHLLSRVLHPLVVHSDIDESLALSFKYDDQDSQEDILEYLYHMSKVGKDDLIVNCAVCTIMYDQPCSLRKVLELLYTGDVPLSRFQRIYTVCKALQRHNCLEILRTCDDREPSEMDIFTTLITLLSAYHAEFSSEIVTALRTLPNVYERINTHCSKNMSLIQIYTSGYQPIAVQEIQALIEAGADTEIVDMKGVTLLKHVLSRRVYFIGFRETLELLLYRNPDTCLHKDAVESATELDLFIESSTIHMVKDLTGSFISDAKEHSLFGKPGTSAYALNFLGPLLIECGFPYSRDKILLALDEPLHEAELEYLRQCLTTPRPLKLRCRDTLRNHFKKRSLHRFLETSSNIPDSIKDFLLLKAEFAFYLF